eukprot:g22680.t1
MTLTLPVRRLAPSPQPEVAVRGNVRQAAMIPLRRGLFLGTAGDAATVDPDSGISHVLTVDSKEPPPLGDRQTMFVRALDDAASDLLSFLDDCVRFVQEALSAAGAAVLVH